MKKIVSVLLILCLGLTVLCACGDDDEETTDTGTDAVATGKFADDNDARYHGSWQQ